MTDKLQNMLDHASQEADRLRLSANRQSDRTLATIFRNEAWIIENGTWLNHMNGEQK